LPTSDLDRPPGTIIAHDRHINYDKFQRCFPD
jgi:hypothetical protein